MRWLLGAIGALGLVVALAPPLLPRPVERTIRAWRAGDPAQRQVVAELDATRGWLRLEQAAGAIAALACCAGAVALDRAARGRGQAADAARRSAS